MKSSIGQSGSTVRNVSSDRLIDSGVWLNGRGASGSDEDKGPRCQTYQGPLQKEMNMRMVGGASNVART